MKNSLELGWIGKGRMFMPMMIIRQIRRLHATPRIRVCDRSLREYGHQTCAITH